METSIAHSLSVSSSNATLLVALELSKATWVVALSVCPEMIFRLRKPFGNKATNSDYFTGRKTSLFSNVFGNLDYNNS
jgi:hypothetical protein